ncbi:MAG TPA: phosphoadenylyl-sulfate reductase [Pirellulaceae bacterium]|nr:phosphoadenylyl-sulfate reductase [Pirellulaceae bacterium]
MNTRSSLTAPFSPTDWAGVKVENPAELLSWALNKFSPNLSIASSWSMEDVTVIDIAANLGIGQLRVFSLDTGRLDPETYEVAERVREKYGILIEWYFPARDPVEHLERTKGLFSFRESVENRKECCGIRKVEPLNRALSGLSAWITGLRREQSVTRTTLDPIEIDHAHGGILKINPLANWTHQDVADYVERNRVPRNRLYDRGYTSIGCAPCTRAIQPGEDLRAGRWWWENPEHKECGLHLNMKTWNPNI